MLHDYAFHNAAKGVIEHSCGAASGMMALFAMNARAMGLTGVGEHYAAAATVLQYGAKKYGKPAFGLASTRIDGEDIGVNETVRMRKTYGDLLQFERDTDRNDPKVLMVAPMSGHYATLLRGTVRAMLPHHDVHITDWRNARDVPRAQGTFGLDDYVNYIRDFLHELGPNTHLMAVCQSAVPALAAVARMAEEGDVCRPLSMTLMGAPIDTRINPTEVNRFAGKHDMAWFRENSLSLVPMDMPGAGQVVYPGYKQLNAFMAMNVGRHAEVPSKIFKHLVAGEHESAAKIGKFYDEYLAVMDLSGPFLIETIERVFKRHDLAKGEMVVSGQLVNPSHVRDTALLTVEGGRDDICGIGQTSAAHDLCNNLSLSRKFAHVEPKAGHYGVFEGSRWEQEIMPRVAAFMRQQGVDKGLKYDGIPADTRLIPPNFRTPSRLLTNLHLVA